MTNPDNVSSDNMLGNGDLEGFEPPSYIYCNRWYYFLTADEWYNEMSEANLIRRLRADGYVEKIDGKPSCTRFILWIQSHRSVRYAGPIAGYKPGLYETPSEGKMLVTRQARPIMPKEGDFTFLREWIESSFDSEGVIQSAYLNGWMSSFAKNFHAQMSSDRVLTHAQPGQCLVLAGQKDCGKSFFATHVIGAMFGNAIAKPYQYMVGETAFNGDFAEAPLLLLDDEVAGSEPAKRRRFGSRIKEMCFSSPTRIHAKGREAISLRPCQRVLVCVNDEPDSLSVLPPLDPSMIDKLMILHMTRSPMLGDGDNLDQRSQLVSRIAAQLPAYLHYLLYEFELPPELAGGRCGVRHFHHPKIAAVLTQLEPEAELLEVLTHLFATDRFECPPGFNMKKKPRKIPWIGTARELCDVIRGSANDIGDCDRLFRGTIGLGQALHRLSLSHPRRVKKGECSNGFNNWELLPLAEVNES